MNAQTQRVDVMRQEEMALVCEALTHAEQALAFLTSIRFPDGHDNDRIRGLIALDKVHRAMRATASRPLRDLIPVHEFKAALARVSGGTP